MDRVISYPGQVPAVEDFLQAQKNAVVSAGRAIHAVMGPVSIATGFAASIDGSANLTLGPGSLTMPGVLDALPYGVLGTDGTAITKQGIGNANVVTALASNIPATVGYACNVLVSATVVDAAAGSLVLAYYNTNAPATPYNGSAGSGAAQPTALLTSVALSFTVGAAVAAGSQPTPSAASGSVPLYVVTLTQGAAPAVAYHPAAPFLAFTLPQLTPGYAREQVFRTSGSFIVPRGSTSVRVFVWGAGGGGGGGFARGVVSVTPGQVIAVSVGAGGAGGVGAANGGAGGGSTFGAALSCAGGAAGSLASAAGAAGGGAGGAGAGGSFNQSGIGGGAGVIFAASSASGGIGGAAFQSSPSGLNVNAMGPAGQMPGAGGNGGASGYAGGAGAAGLVIVEY